MNTFQFGCCNVSRDDDVKMIRFLIENFFFEMSEQERETIETMRALTAVHDLSARQRTWVKEIYNRLSRAASTLVTPRRKKS